MIIIVPGARSIPGFRPGSDKCQRRFEMSRFRPAIMGDFTPAPTHASARAVTKPSTRRANVQGRCIIASCNPACRPRDDAYRARESYEVGGVVRRMGPRSCDFATASRLLRSG